MTSAERDQATRELVARLKAGVMTRGAGEERDAERAAVGVTAAMTRVWLGIRRRHPEVPAAVVVLAGATTDKGELSKWGHWSAGSWRVEGQDGKHVSSGEVLVAAEVLDPKARPGGESDPARKVLEVLLHEAAHALADSRKIKDTSRQGRFHNARYAELAGELGLLAAPGARHGWETSLDKETAEVSYASELADLRQALRGWRALPSPKAAKDDEVKAGGRRLRVECGCNPPRTFRIVPSVLERAPITCEACGSPFEAND